MSEAVPGRAVALVNLGCRVNRVELDLMASELERAGVNVTVRRKLGGDIDASCGQLRKKAAAAGQGAGQDPGDGA